MPSTSKPLVEAKPGSVRLLLTATLSSMLVIRPPLRLSAAPTAIPLLSKSPLRTMYWNSKVLVPVPLR